MKLRKVKFTGAAGQTLAVSNELQPFVVTQDLAGAAHSCRDGISGFRYKGQYRFSRLTIHRCIGGKRFNVAALLQERFKEFVFQVRSGGNVRKIEKCVDCRLVSSFAIERQEPVQTLLERFQPQVKANLLAAGELIENQSSVRHARVGELDVPEKTQS